MAFNINTLSDYAAKATELLRSGVLYNEDFSEFDYQTGIQYKEFLNFVEVDPTLVAGSCGATDNGTTNLTEKVITVIPMKSDNRFCFDELYKKALSNIDVPKAITQDFIDKLKVKVESTLWSGDTLGVQGWLAEASGDTSVVDVFGVALTVTNIDDAINEMIANIPNALTSRGILTVYVSYANYNLYKRNRLAANLFRDANADFGVNEMWVFGYEGQIKIKAVAGFGTNNTHLLLTWSKNLVIGTDDVNQVSSAKWVIDEVEEYAWLKSKFKLGTTYKFGTEIVLYTVS